MKKAVVFLADGFEEMEAIITIDLLRRAGIEVVVAGVTGKTCVGAHNLEVKADEEASNLNFSDFDALICPGGSVGAENLKNSALVISAIKKAYASKKLVCAICAGPLILNEAGVLEGKKYTIYPSLKDSFTSGEYVKKNAVTSSNVITGAGPGATPDFAFAIIDYLLSKQVADRTASDAIFKR